MFNKQLKRNIKGLDLEIGRRVEELSSIKDEDEYEVKLQKIEDLTKFRGQLAESKVKDSVKSAIVSGAFSLAGILLVLKHEQANVITSRAIGMATGMFKRS